MEANVILARCHKSKKLFGIRVQRMSDGDWWRTWSFPLNEQLARNEGYDKQTIEGSFRLTEDARGCPYCGNVRLVKCSCGKLGCEGGAEGQWTCPWCGITGRLAPLNRMSTTGGDM